MHSFDVSIAKGQIPNSDFLLLNTELVFNFISEGGAVGVKALSYLTPSMA